MQTKNTALRGSKILLQLHYIHIYKNFKHRRDPVHSGISIKFTLNTYRLHTYNCIHSKKVAFDLENGDYGFRHLLYKYAQFCADL
jgi:hypothetical protein